MQHAAWLHTAALLKTSISTFDIRRCGLFARRAADRFALRL
jgi:hypothetical protein